ncbi:glycerophosphodiester phosphodiesterase [uncultured Nocardioides sp.]|uniref:glycerophosphodiester phosphodiesterase n=1 Tax=uncultured Nocardioides sp. TaxID=198441 RepID=UPI00262DDD7A|nr:glycerophosphodiester phosphodiesterase [uncultured Nocardioides sp.]
MTTRVPALRRALLGSLSAGLALAVTATVAPPGSATTDPPLDAPRSVPSDAAQRSAADTSAQRAARGQVRRPLVTAHRGASGYRPEHTLAAYQLGIRLGADYVEPDLVSTKDGRLVARHENEISGTTNVDDLPQYADRETTKTIDGEPITGFFTEDFTLAELRTLRAEERLPDVRPDNTRYDGRFQVPTFEEILRLVRDHNAKPGRDVGLYIETKHPTYFDSIGLSLEEPMVRTLRRFGFDEPRSKVFLQSFETGNLRELDSMTDLPLVQLMDVVGGPYDLEAKGDPTTYEDLASRQGLRGVSEYADVVGPEKTLVIPRNADGSADRRTALVGDAHEFGMRVHVFTIRDENQFMATDWRRGDDPNAKGNVFGEITSYLDAGIDGFFADYPDSGVDARDAWVAANR